MGSHLSFGFGSNTNLEELQSVLLGSVELIGPCWCPESAPVYHYRSGARDGGALDMVPAQEKGIVTPGVILELDDAARKSLDRKEGHPNAYCRVPTSVLNATGELLNVETYLVNESRQEDHHVPPTKEYESIVASGMESHGHDVTPFYQAAKGKAVTPIFDSIFVYGTLMRGEVRENILADFGVRDIRSGCVPGKLLDLGQFPGMLKSDNSDQLVKGELISLERISDAIEAADQVEGFTDFGSDDNLFDRRLITVTLEDGTNSVAWVYLFNADSGHQAGLIGDGQNVINSGSWSNR